MEEKIKVAWICQVSNAFLRSYLDLRLPLWRKMIGALRGEVVKDEVPDNSHWNSNAIDEFAKLSDVELHVVFVHSNMRKHKQCFSANGIKFYAINAGDTSLLRYIKWHIPRITPSYKGTWNSIKTIIEKISPDIVHIMGAENPPYSQSALYLPHGIPIIVQLQTLLHSPESMKLYPKIDSQRRCEEKVLKRADYIGTKIPEFAKTIRDVLQLDTVIVNTRLMIVEKPTIKDDEKLYDFVYFASDISKSIDLAIEAFGMAFKKYPGITLDVIGGVSDTELKQLSDKITQLGCNTYVKIEGKLPTHEDVMHQIKKAKFALLPLKTDFISGTIREAIWSGLPVVTTITSGTPLLNEKRLSVLLSATGDHEALAKNMCKLIEDSSLASEIRKNALITLDERYGGNSETAQEWLKTYKACINHSKYNTPIPSELINSY